MKYFVFNSVLTRYIKIVCAGLFVVSSAFAAGSTLKGNITYTLHKSESPTDDDLDAYTRITAVMDSAVKIYNTYTALTKHINVYYAPGVPTAEASSNGDLRFGSNRSYMFVGTAMHEMAHTLGMGTTTEYRNMLEGGAFKGEKAQAKLKELTGDETQVLKGDSQHFWPYGLNYASEVKSEEDLIFHAQIVEAMYQDIFKEAFFKEGKLKSLSDGTCMGITSSNGLELMDCSAEGTAVKIWSVGDNPVTYRIGFGNRVLDIPNESSAAGVVASTYGWNGGAHQRYIMEQAAEGDAFYLQNYKSKLYLLASGKNVVQDQRNRNVESGAWILLENAAAVPAEKDSAETVPPDTSETPSVADSSERNPEAGADGIQNGAVRRGVGKNGGVVPRERFDVLGRSLKRGGKVSKYLKLFRGEVR